MTKLTDLYFLCLLNICNKHIVLIITYAIYYIFLFQKLFIDYFVNFSKCTPIPFISSSLLICSQSLQSPPKRKQTDYKQNKTTSRKLLQLKLQCVTMCHIVYPFAQTALLVDMFISMSHWTGLRPLPSAALSILNPHQLSSQNPIVLCPGDPTALLLQAWSLHLLQQFLDRVDVGVKQLKAFYLSLDGTWIS